MAERVSAAEFAAFIRERIQKKDGYILCATGQNPKQWARSSWWFTQYTGANRAKALAWRDKAERVWDCNGLAEGYYRDRTGIDINTKARTNYAVWCATCRGEGTIPAQRRVPGAAVFRYEAKKGYITHVAFLLRPVDEKEPGGDWYLGEARGVGYGVVETKSSGRAFNRWGWMEKYFDYGDPVAPETAVPPAASGNPYPLPARLIRRGCEGEDVKWVQYELLRRGYGLGKPGLDGKCGKITSCAIVNFQADASLVCDGIVGRATRAALKGA